ncbi:MULTISPECIES: hypothetical protein [unclassified Streptomyces]|uniref:hypothetical protein n=1 Tax=unclassified Streptomyces TaxID=2593676 RepID=UPI001F37BDF5|nr:MULTISPECIES: hypothetical protein [unclassified Streptomyces]
MQVLSSGLGSDHCMEVHKALLERSDLAYGATTSSRRPASGAWSTGAVVVGVFVRIRGWLECDDRQLVQVKEIVGADDPDRTYGEGWAFPARQYNFTNWVFFGAEMHAQSADWFLDQLHRVARVPASDDDNDLITGLFLVSHESDGMSEWRVRDGIVLIGAPSGEYRFLDE